MGNLYSLKVEKYVLGGLLNHPFIFTEIERYVTEKDFYNEVHSTIFGVIKNSLHSGENVNKILIAEKIRNLGVAFKDEIDIFSYINNISFTQITPKHTIENSQELLKLRVRRELSETVSKIQKVIETNGNESISDIISKCDSIYGEKIKNYTLEEEPMNIVEGLADLIEERGNNPQEDVGFLTSYEEFDRMYGGLRSGNVYAIVSRPGQGKTTWINNVCLKAAKANNAKVLILDTEMETVDIQFRTAASLTGVSLWHLETGNWRKNRELTSKVRSSFENLGDHGECYHAFVGNKNIDQICSLVRRWCMKNLKEGEKCIIAYDYIKLTGERVGANWAEYQAIGLKIDKIKKLAEEVNAPLVTAMQLNRSGESFNRNSRNIVDDSSAISLSDRLQWFASFVAIFRRKTVDEVALDGERFGTHKLIPIKTRFQGQFAAGHQDFLRRRMEDGTEIFANNYLNYNVENFGVEERGSLRNIIEAENQQYLIEDENPNDGEVL